MNLPTGSIPNSLRRAPQYGPSVSDPPNPLADALYTVPDFTFLQAAPMPICTAGCYWLRSSKLTS